MTWLRASHQPPHYAGVTSQPGPVGLHLNDGEPARLGAPAPWHLEQCCDSLYLSPGRWVAGLSDFSRDGSQKSGHFGDPTPCKTTALGC